MSPWPSQRGRACFNSQECCGGPSPIKTEPLQIVLLLLLCVVVLLCCVLCCVLCLVSCVLCLVCWCWWSRWCQKVTSSSSQKQIRGTNVVELLRSVGHNLFFSFEKIRLVISVVVSSSTYLFGWTDDGAVTASSGANTTKMRSQQRKKDQTNERSGLCHLGRHGSYFYCVKSASRPTKRKSNSVFPAVAHFSGPENQIAQTQRQEVTDKSARTR